MTDVTFSDAELQRRRFEAFSHFLELIASGHADSSVIDLDGGVRAVVSPVSPYRSLFNSVMFEQPDALVAALPELTRLYEQAGVHAWTVWCPRTDANAAARAALEDAGHVLDADPREMGAPLTEVSLDAGELPVGLELGSCTWAEVAVANELAYKVPAGSFSSVLMDVPVDPGRHVVAVLDGDEDVVSCGAFIENGDNVEATFIATDAEWRGRGLATQVMKQGLLDAQVRGCLTTTLEATKAGEPVYAAMGFRSFDTLEMWERRSPAAADE